MDADTQDKHDAVHRHELALQNGKADDDAYKTVVLIELCRVVKTILAEHSGNHKHRHSFWPKNPMELVSFVILVGSLCTTLWKILG